MKRNKRFQNAHSAILKSAYELFMENGYTDTAIGDIARHAGVSRKTVFNHFTGKEDLLIEMASMWYENDAAMQKTLALDTCKPILPQLASRLLMRLQLMDDYYEFMKMILLHTHAIGSGEALLPIEDIAVKPRHRGLYEIYQAFERAASNGELREGVTALSAYQAYIALRNMVIQSWLLTKDKARLIEDAKMIMDILFNGISRDQGKSE